MTNKLRVWWIPQVPMKAFYVLVNNIQEAKLILDTLADYDQFQFDNKVKPDYSNIGGLQVWDDEVDADETGSKWIDWEHPDTCESFNEYCEQNPELFNL